MGVGSGFRSAAPGSAIGMKWRIRRRPYPVAAQIAVPQAIRAGGSNSTVCRTWRLFHQPVEDRRLFGPAASGQPACHPVNRGRLFGIAARHRIRDRGRRREVEPALAPAARKAKRGDQARSSRPSWRETDRTIGSRMPLHDPLAPYQQIRTSQATTRMADPKEFSAARGNKSYVRDNSSIGPRRPSRGAIHAQQRRSLGRELEENSCQP